MSELNFALKRRDMAPPAWVILSFVPSSGSGKLRGSDEAFFFGGRSFSQQPSYHKKQLAIMHRIIGCIDMHS